jgi:hypothetical protein
MASKNKLAEKPEKIRTLIEEALIILESVGLPLNKKGERALEVMAMSFLAVAGVTKSWKEAQGQTEHRNLKTRDIISYINENYFENISPGSYDDIRRKHLKLIVLADLIINSADNPSASQNNPTRGYTLDNDFKELIKHYGTGDWDIKLKLFNKNRPSLSDILARKRDTKKIRITLPSGHILEFGQGSHNQLQREIIEEFLPRFGFGCTVLYVGDSSNRFLHKDDDKLSELGFFDLADDLLPDVVAYNEEKNWIYLIEAVHSSGAMTEERIYELQKLLKDCKGDLIFVTAFISRTELRKHIKDIGWESEVWTADNPEHLIHFNGGKFLGPYRHNS